MDIWNLGYAPSFLHSKLLGDFVLYTSSGLPGCKFISDIFLDHWLIKSCRYSGIEQTEFVNDVFTPVYSQGGSQPVTGAQLALLYMIMGIYFQSNFT
jgi:hypothetical protein